MSSASNMRNVGAVALGHVGLVASWRREDNRHHYTQLVIQSCAVTDERVHTPASSISIYGRESLLALRDAIDEALKEVEA